MSLNQSPPAPGLYRVDLSASSIKVAAKHMFGLGTVKGTFGLDSGEITVADPVAQSTVRATADAGSFATGNAKRDEQSTRRSSSTRRSTPRSRSHQPHWSRRTVSGHFVVT